MSCYKISLIINYIFLQRLQILGLCVFTVVYVPVNEENNQKLSSGQPLDDLRK